MRVVMSWIILTAFAVCLFLWVGREDSRKSAELATVISALSNSCGAERSITSSIAEMIADQALIRERVKAAEEAYARFRSRVDLAQATGDRGEVAASSPDVRLWEQRLAAAKGELQENIDNVNRARQRLALLDSQDTTRNTNNIQRRAVIEGELSFFRQTALPVLFAMFSLGVGGLVVSLITRDPDSRDQALGAFMAAGCSFALPKIFSRLEIFVDAPISINYANFTLVFGTSIFAAILARPLYKLLVAIPGLERGR